MIIKAARKIQIEFQAREFAGPQAVSPMLAPADVFRCAALLVK